MESETLWCLDSLWACVGSRYPPIIKPYDSRRWHAWALGQRFSRVLFAGEDNILFPIQEDAQSAQTLGTPPGPFSFLLTT